MHFEIGRRSVFALKTEDLTCKQAAGASGHRAEVRRCLRRAYDKPNWWFSRQITLKTSNAKDQPKAAKKDLELYSHVKDDDKKKKKVNYYEII